MSTEDRLRVAYDFNGDAITDPSSTDDIPNGGRIIIIDAPASKIVPISGCVIRFREDNIRDEPINVGVILEAVGLLYWRRVHDVPKERFVFPQAAAQVLDLLGIFETSCGLRQDVNVKPNDWSWENLQQVWNSHLYPGPLVPMGEAHPTQVRRVLDQVYERLIALPKGSTSVT